MRNFNLDDDLKRHVKPGLIISAFTVFLIYLLMNLGNIYGMISTLLGTLVYLFYGIIIAYILNQPMKLIEKQITKYCTKTSFLYRKKRGLSIIATLILFICLIVLIASIVIPNLISSLISLISNTSAFLTSVFNNIDDIFIYFNIDFRMENIASVKDLINMPWQDMVGQALDILTRSAGGIMNNATNFLSTFGVVFTGFIFSLYLLGNKETFLRQLRKAIGALCGYKVTCVMFVGAVLILSKDALMAIWFMVYFQILSQLEDNFIYPRVVGNSVGLPGIWVLLSIFVFGDLFGVFGMVIAVPSAACLYSLASEVINMILKKRKLVITENTIEQK